MYKENAFSRIDLPVTAREAFKMCVKKLTVEASFSLYSRHHMSLRRRHLSRTVVVHLDPVIADGFMRLLSRSSVHSISVHAHHVFGAVRVFLVVRQLGVVVACTQHCVSIATAPAQYGAGQ